MIINPYMFGVPVNIRNSYPFSTDAVDIIAGNNGTLTNGATITSSSLYCDGVNDYCIFPNNSFNLTSDFSISFYFKTYSTGVNYIIFSNFIQIAGNYGIKIDQRSDNRIRFAIYDGGVGSVVSLETSVFLTTGTYYHVVVTRKFGSRSRIYIDKTLNISNSNTINPIYYSTNYPTVGVSKFNTVSFEQYANINMYQLKIFNEELTQTQINAL